MEIFRKKYQTPKYVESVNSLEFKDLKQAVQNGDEKFLKKLIRKMYVNKEAFILKNSASKDLKKL